MHSHCSLKQIVLQARPLRWRICYDFCDRPQIELSVEGLVQQFLIRSPVWEPHGAMGGPAFLMLELPAQFLRKGSAHHGF